jgi:hypothetical protein
MEAVCSSETSVDFNGLHGVITQKIELFKERKEYKMESYIIYADN